MFTWERKVASQQERKGDPNFSSTRVQPVSIDMNYNGSVSPQTYTSSHTLHKLKVFLALAVPIRLSDYCVLRGPVRISALYFMLSPKTWPFFGFLIPWEPHKFSPLLSCLLQQGLIFSGNIFQYLFPMQKESKAEASLPACQMNLWWWPSPVLGRTQAALVGSGP